MKRLKTNLVVNLMEDLQRSLSSWRGWSLVGNFGGSGLVPWPCGGANRLLTAGVRQEPIEYHRAEHFGYRIWSQGKFLERRNVTCRVP